MLSRNSCVKRLNANTSIRTGKRSDSSQLLHRAEKGGRNNILQKPLDKTASAGVLRCAFLVSYAAHHWKWQMLICPNSWFRGQAAVYKSKLSTRSLYYWLLEEVCHRTNHQLTWNGHRKPMATASQSNSKINPFWQSPTIWKRPFNHPPPHAILYFIFNYSEPYQWGLFSV